MNNDLTKFNLEQAGYSVSTLTKSDRDCENDEWLVAIYNNNEQITYTLPPSLSYEEADALMTKVRDCGVVNLTLWDASPIHIWDHACYQQSEEDARAEQLGMQEAEFISGYIHAGGNQWDAQTEWNARIA